MSATIETAAAASGTRTGQNPLKLKRVHHVEFWTGNGKQSSFFYRKAFGFSQIAYSGLETGSRDVASYVLGQGKIRFVLSTPLRPDHPAAEHIRQHGDGVRDIALLVEDADFAFAEAVRRGATPVAEPYDMTDDHGTVRRAAVQTYGNTIHSFSLTTTTAVHFYLGTWRPRWRGKTRDCWWSIISSATSSWGR